MALNILDFKLSVVAEIPKDKNIFVERLMLDAIQELCRESHCWIETVTGMLSVKDTATYAVTVSTSNAEIINIHQGKYNNETIENISNRTMDHRETNWESRSGSPDAFIYDGDYSIRFNVTPDTSGKAVSFEAVIMPNSIDGVIPPRIEKRHREAIKAYVKWKVYESEKYFDPIKSGKFERDFTRRKNALKVEVARDGEDIEVRGRSFVSGKVRSQRSFSAG